MRFSQARLLVDDFGATFVQAPVDQPDFNLLELFQTLPHEG